MTIKPAPLYLTSTYGYDVIRPALRRGDIGRLRRGAYTTPPDPRHTRWDAARARELAHCEAVAATLTTPFAFSHETAGFLLKWPGPIRPRVHITQTFRPRSGMSDDIVRHYRPEIPPEDIVYVNELPVLAPARSAIDCALAYRPSTALAYVDAALRQLAAVDRFEREESIERQEPVRAELVQRLAAQGPVRHVRRARALLEHASGFAESGPESWIRWVALSRGLPLPELQLPVETARGTLFPDLMWPDLGPVMCEYDGMDKYDEEGEAVVAQTDREQLLIETAGGRVVRFTKHTERRDPDAAFRRLLGAFPPGTLLTPRRDLLEHRVRP